MRTLILAAVAATFIATPVLADPPSWAPAHGYRDKHDKNDKRDTHEDRDEARDDRRDYRDERRNYSDDRQGYGYNNGGYNNGGNNWYADQHYRDGGNYRARYLGPNDQVYRGQDNRYYCRRSDGTTGLIIGGLGGGVLGNVIAPGGSKTLGTILGGGLGAVLGRSIDRNKVSCR